MTIFDHYTRCINSLSATLLSIDCGQFDDVMLSELEARRQELETELAAIRGELFDHISQLHSERVRCAMRLRYLSGTDIGSIANDMMMKRKDIRRLLHIGRMQICRNMKKEPP